MSVVSLSNPTLIRSRVEYTRNLKWKHLYRCFCGVEFIAIGADVNSGRTVSCGCWQALNSKLRFTKHGMNKCPEHRAWVEMKRRCSDSTRPQWEHYGGRGIKVCASWLESFENFYRDMGPKLSNDLSLDRIDNDGNYEPGNCRWATKKEQANNQRRTKRTAA